LWKAGNDAYLSHPELMKRLGAAGDIVAAALAVLKTHKPEAAARRAVVSKLETGLKKSLQAGAASPSTGRGPALSIDTPEGLAQFNAYIDKVKGG
jgi:hypothetical protein